MVRVSNTVESFRGILSRFPATGTPEKEGDSSTSAPGEKREPTPDPIPSVGALVGIEDGTLVGREDGMNEGKDVGVLDGSVVGIDVGASSGTEVTEYI